MLNMRGFVTEGHLQLVVTAYLTASANMLRCFERLFTQNAFLPCLPSGSQHLLGDW